MKVYTLEYPLIGPFLDRHQKKSGFQIEPRLDEFLEKILRIANEFVPSEAGSILLDDPVMKLTCDQDGLNELVFIACYGEKAERLPGVRVPANKGIIGQTYVSGVPYMSRDVRSDDHFYREVDRITSYATESIVCVPITIGTSVCGVLELLNRKGDGDAPQNYVERDLELLETFDNYISTSIQNILDAKRHQELAKLDDLTGLYNDRYFYQRIVRDLKRAVKHEHDLSVIFIDLDNFKVVNDVYGHLAGSSTLTEVGGLLVECVGYPGSTVARYGGDEFIVIVPNVDLARAHGLAETIRETICSHSFLAGSNPDGAPPLNIGGVVGASIGVASLSELLDEAGSDETSVQSREKSSQKARLTELDLEALKEALIRRADKAMYRAKEIGKNRVFSSLSNGDSDG